MSAFATKEPESNGNSLGRRVSFFDRVFRHVLFSSKPGVFAPSLSAKVNAQAFSTADESLRPRPAWNRIGVCTPARQEPAEIFATRSALGYALECEDSRTAAWRRFDPAA